jgi:soluble lytic murein transglycosylase
LAKIIPALWLSGLGLMAGAGWWAAEASGPAPSAAKKRPAKHPAAPAAKAKPTGATLAEVVRPWRENPTPARRAAVDAWAAAHPKDAMAVRLALGIGAYEQKDFAGSVAALKKVQGKLPQIADYVNYYSAAARVELKDAKGIGADLQPTHAAGARSPFSGRAWILEARGVKESTPAEAVRLLREHYAELPQPEGDINLADGYLAAGEPARAAGFYQRVYYQYASGDAATRAAAGLASLRQSMGDAYPAPPATLQLHRADRLLETRSYAEARSEYRALGDQLTGLERDQARVRVGAASFLEGNTPTAYPYLRGLELADSEAEAERQYYLVECARRLTDDDEMRAALDALQRRYPRSMWRLKALVSAANRFLLANQPDQFVPLNRAVYQDFPTAAEAPVAHWKVTFQAFLRNGPDSASLLREHLRNYPGHSSAGSALYFLGRRQELDGDAGGARACYEKLTSAFENHYYSMLARQRLAEPAMRAATPSAEVAQFIAGLSLPAARPVPREATAATNARIERSRILRHAGLDDLADGELRFGARTDGQAPLLGMEMAGAAEAPHQAMHVLKGLAPEYLNLALTDAPRRFWELLFPLPYRTDLERAARQQELDPFLVAGLVRQESEFDPRALSRANAYGLAQVRPVTGKEYARKAGIARFSNRMLFQPATNLSLGTLILSSMLGKNGGRVEETLAAYNAGPTRLANWLTWNQYREPAEFVESIPYTETRDYVQAVLRNADIYRRLYKQ